MYKHEPNWPHGGAAIKDLNGKVLNVQFSL